MDTQLLEIVMIFVMIYVGVIILAVWYAYEEDAIEDHIRRQQRRSRRRQRRRRQQRPTSFMIVAFVYTAQECIQALANRLNFTTSYEIFKEYCSSETYAESGRPRALQNECVICREEFQATDACLVLGECGHVFHERCVKPWLRLWPNCPNCRSDIPLFTFE